MAFLFGLHSSHQQQDCGIFEAFTKSSSELADHKPLALVFEFLPQYRENPTTEMSIKKLTKKDEMLSQRQAFIKIYQALRDGQSGIFKTNTWSKKTSLSDLNFIQEITNYASRYPNSRTAKAWTLTQQHNYKAFKSNTILVNDIYQWSFARSGFFKQSKVTGDTFYRSTSYNRRYPTGMNKYQILCEKNDTGETFYRSASSYNRGDPAGLNRRQIEEGERKNNSRTNKICCALGARQR